MIKFQIRVVGVLVILLMLGASPISVIYSFAENHSEQEENRELRVILTEKVVDGKLEVRQYVLPNEISETDLKRIISFDGQISWAYVNYKMYQSGIILFDGKISKIGENLWGISTESKSDENLSFKIMFSGKNGETGKESEFVLSLMNSVIKNPETVQNIRLLQIGESEVNSEQTDGSSHEFRNSYW
jgi:hypothetical protein